MGALIDVSGLWRPSHRTALHRSIMKKCCAAEIRIVLCPNNGVLIRCSEIHAIFIPAVTKAADNITLFLAYSQCVEV